MIVPDVLLICRSGHATADFRSSGTRVIMRIHHTSSKVAVDPQKYALRRTLEKMGIQGNGCLTAGTYYTQTH